jgi:hypothetical protein
LTRKAVKGNTIADHLTNNIVEDYEPLNFDLYDEDVLVVKDDGEMNDWWTMNFDGAVKVLENKVRAVIISL